MKLKIILLALFVLFSSCSADRYFNNQNRTIAGKYDSYEVKEQFTLPPATKRLIDFEQKLIDRNVDTEKIMSPDIAAQDEVFRPENQKWFTLKTYWIPESELDVVNHSSGDINTLMAKTINGQRYYRLIVHPESETFYEDLTSKFIRAEDMFGTSTSSSRTVLIRSKEGKLFFGKLSLNVKLGGVVRTIPKGEVARSVGTNLILDQIQKTEDQTANPFKYLRESFGLIPKDYERGGMIIREIPEVPKTHALLPLFSIYAKNNGESSILKKWISVARKENKLPDEWIKEKVLAPFAKGWVHAYFDQRIIMEAHAQNVMIEVDKDNLPVGKFFHRDFGGFNIDLDFYKQNAWFKDLPIFTDLATDYHQKFRKDAIVQSLDTYFEGGFIFNLNREYAEVTGDTSIDFRNEFRKILAEEIKKHEGVQLDFANGSKFYGAISKLETKVKVNPKGFLKNLCSGSMEAFF